MHTVDGKRGAVTEFCRSKVTYLPLLDWTFGLATEWKEVGVQKGKTQGSL